MNLEPQCLDAGNCLFCRYEDIIPFISATYDFLLNLIEGDVLLKMSGKNLKFDQTLF